MDWIKIVIANVLESLPLIILAVFCAFVVYMVMTAHIAKQAEPIESSRRVIINCTVKSNIDGVITLNDECKMTVIGEE